MPWAVGRRGGVERHALFGENITFSHWVDDPTPFFQPNYRNDPPPPLFKSLPMALCAPLPSFFENFERQGQIPLSVSSYLCLFSLLYKPLQPKKYYRGPLTVLTWMHVCYHMAFHFSFSPIIEITPDDRKLTSLSVKFGEL